MRTTSGNDDSPRPFAHNLFELYRQHSGEFDALADPVALFILAFINHIESASLEQLSDDIGLSHMVLRRLLQSLQRSRLLIADSAMFRVTESGRSLLQETGIASQEETTTYVAEDTPEQTTRSQTTSDLDAEHDIRNLATASDHDLIQSCLGGDERAWKVLVERYGRLVYSIPLRWGLATDDADDVFKNVFTIVFHQLERLRDRAMLPAWLITVTHRETMRKRKRLARNGKVFAHGALMDTMSPSDVETWERQDYVRQALSQLDPEGRKLLTLLFLDPSSSSYKEIAARLGLPEGRIGPMRARSFKKLDAILAELDANLMRPKVPNKMKSDEPRSDEDATWRGRESRNR